MVFSLLLTAHLRQTSAMLERRDINEKSQRRR